MFATSTALVLGAGSSVDFGMPLGSQLLTEISETLTPDEDGGVRDPAITAAFLKAFPEAKDELQRAAALVRSAAAGFQSIDDILDFYRKDKFVVRLGKIAIARVISAHESKSPVIQLWNSDSRGAGIEWANRTWVREFVSIAITGFRGDDVGEIFANLVLVNFNYDRCAESIIYALLMSYAGLNSEQAARAMSGLKVYNPYGSLGGLPYYSKSPGIFGDPMADIGKLADGILLYTEDTGERPDLEGLTDTISKAQTVIMLGFGFHSQNLRLLAGENPERSDGKVFASAIGEQVYATPHIEQRLRQMLPKANGNLLGTTNAACADLFALNRRVFQG